MPLRGKRAFDIVAVMRRVRRGCDAIPGVAAAAPRISVDVHVWRVVSRWGCVQARTLGKTEEALARRFRKRYWIELNRQLVAFGKHICAGARPRCSGCPVLEYCRQVGVTEHR